MNRTSVLAVIAAEGAVLGNEIGVSIERDGPASSVRGLILGKSAPYNFHVGPISDFYSATTPTIYAPPSIIHEPVSEGEVGNSEGSVRHFVFVPEELSFAKCIESCTAPRDDELFAAVVDAVAVVQAHGKFCTERDVDAGSGLAGFEELPPI
jgi:hypothetical protein